MKRYLYCCAFIIGLVIWENTNNVFYSKNNYSDLFIENVEVLASGESGGQPMDCYSTVESVNDGRPVYTKTYCADCKPIRCTHWSNYGRCVR